MKPSRPRIDFGKIFVFSESGTETAHWTNNGTADVKVSGVLVNKPFHVSGKAKTVTVKPGRKTPKYKFSFRPVAKGKVDHKAPPIAKAMGKPIVLAGEGVWRLSNGLIDFGNLPESWFFYPPGASAPVRDEKPLDFGKRPKGDYEVIAEFMIRNNTNRDMTLALSLNGKCPYFRIINPAIPSKVRIRKNSFRAIRLGFKPKKIGKWDDLLLAVRSSPPVGFAGIVITGEVVAEEDFDYLAENESSHVRGRKKGKKKSKKGKKGKKGKGKAKKNKSRKSRPAKGDARKRVVESPGKKVKSRASRSEKQR